MLDELQKIPVQDLLYNYLCKYKAQMAEQIHQHPQLPLLWCIKEHYPEWMNYSIAWYDGYSHADMHATDTPHYRPLPPVLFDTLFDLVKVNMLPYFDETSINNEDVWSDARKRREMKDDHPKFIVIFHHSHPINTPADATLQGTVAAFLYFQFVMEEVGALPGMEPDIDLLELPVVYCYELQVDKQHQKKGFGKLLMELMEYTTLTWNLSQSNKEEDALLIQKAVLTVFKKNMGALHLYQNKLGYSVDLASPSRFLPARKATRFNYEILSKII